MSRPLQLTSPVFGHNSAMPSRFTCDHESKGKINPPLQLSGVDPNAKSLVLIMDDPDAPTGTWDHWVVFNIPSTITTIAEGQEPEGIPGKNSWGTTGYGGPCPPNGEHHYFFKLYALDTILDLTAGATKAEVEAAMQGHIFRQAELIGLYARQ